MTLTGYQTGLGFALTYIGNASLFRLQSVTRASLDSLITCPELLIDPLDGDRGGKRTAQVLTCPQHVLLAERGELLFVTSGRDISKQLLSWVALAVL